LEFAFVYIDDVLVASKDVETHMQHLRRLFEKLQEHGLVINVSKCQFGRDTLGFLGHRITSAGSMPPPEKVETITDLAQPTTIKGLREFVGIVNFYRRFIPAAAQTMLPLFEALTGKPKALVWNDAMAKLFMTPKRLWLMQLFSHTLARMLLSHSLPTLQIWQ
jgi:hypothetical protein